MAWLWLSLRRVRDAPVPSLAVALFVFVTAFVLAIGPRLLETASSQSLRAEATAVRADVRGLQLDQVGRIEPGVTDGMLAVERTGSDLESRIPAAVDSLVVDRSTLATTPRFVARGYDERTLRVRFEGGVGRSRRADRWSSARGGSHDRRCDRRTGRGGGHLR